MSLAETAASMCMPITQLQFLPNMNSSALGLESMTLGMGDIDPGHSLPTAMAFNDNSVLINTLTCINQYNIAPNFNACMPPAWSNYEPSIYSMEPTPGRHDSLISLDPCPPIKVEEEQSPIDPSNVFYATPVHDSDPDRSSSSGMNDSKASNFSTDVDTLMKAIQLKTQPSQTGSEAFSSNSPELRSPPRPRKRYQCSIPDCNKSFYQKTHLEIHTRAHTGIKPFVSASSRGC